MAEPAPVLDRGPASLAASGEGMGVQSVALGQSLLLGRWGDAMAVVIAGVLACKYLPARVAVDRNQNKR